MSGDGHLLVVLAVALIGVVVLVACDPEWRARRARKRAKRREEREHQCTVRALYADEARRLRTEAKQRWVAAVTCPRLDTTPLPARSPLHITGERTDA